MVDVRSYFQGPCVGYVYYDGKIKIFGFQDGQIDEAPLLQWGT